jgi:signal peptidase I
VIDPSGDGPAAAAEAEAADAEEAPRAGGPLGEPPADDPRRQRGFFGELPVLIIIAFVLALLLKTFLVQAFFIPSSSMEPTLLEQDRVLVNKLVYRFREPARGEVIVFTKRDEAPELDEVEPAGPVGRFLESVAGLLGMGREGERDFIKRIIGLPGETIEMRDGVVYVDDEPLPEAPTDEGGYLAMRDMESYGPYEVPEGHLFMMGDNRPNSADSRFPSLGTIPVEDVVGRAFVVIWPVDRLRSLPGADYAPQLAAPVAPSDRVPVGATMHP